MNDVDIDDWLEAVDPDVVRVLVHRKYLWAPYDKVPKSDASLDEKWAFRWTFEAARRVFLKDNPPHEIGGFP